MYAYTWDPETGGLLLNSSPLPFSKEPRPVYCHELNILGLNHFWKYQDDDTKPYMWAEANNYIYRGRLVAQLKGGSLYTAPEVKIISEPEPNGGELRQVDIDGMVSKNEEIIDRLTKDTIKRIYKAFIDYRDRVQIFHVSFSGGKDSEVTLDLVQKALPHNKFVVVFGDTRMEFPDTYRAIEVAKERCAQGNIKFYVARSHFDPMDSWRIFGPPASSIRWCCSVHKTTPQLLLLREVLGKDDFSEMAFVGVRGDESLRRSEYDYISYSKKHKGQWSCYPILEWNSAEVYLYLYKNGLYFNGAYKKGLSRAGCLMCPMAAKTSEFMRRANYQVEVDKYINVINELNATDKGNEARLKSYIENNGWRARLSGRDLSIAKRDYQENGDKNSLQITFKDNDIWREWIKTIGEVCENDSNNSFSIVYSNRSYQFFYKKGNDGYSSVRITIGKLKEDAEFLKKFRRVFRKSHYCVGCRVCEANCKHGNLTFTVTGKPIVSDTCTHCGMCLDIDTGCWVYNSLWLSNNNNDMKQKSLDCYSTHAPKMEWFDQYVKLGDHFDSDNSLGNNEVQLFKRFLRDAYILSKDVETNLGRLLKSRGVEDENVWGLMLTNLSYSPQVGWFVRNFNVGENYSQQYISSVLSNIDGVSTRAIKSIPTDLRRLFNLPIGKVGLGVITNTTKEDGYIVCRQPWQQLSPLVLLYSLYKYAEACGSYYQFSLSRLYDEGVNSDGVSPARIFGVEQEKMKQILNGLSVSHSDYINVAFTFDLDNITLKADKTSDDVLDLF